MNWYLKNKTADAPFPSTATDIPPGYTTGLGNVDRYMDEEIAKQESQKHKKMRYIGSGLWGAAFEVPGQIAPNEVIKYTPSTDEFSSVMQLIRKQQEKGGSLPGVVHVYDMEQKGKHLYKIRMEKVQPLTIFERDVVDMIFFPLIHGGKKTLNGSPLLPLWRTIQDYVIRNASKLGLATSSEDIAQKQLILNIAKNYWKMLSQIHSFGGKLFDTKGANIGKRSDGSYVLLDLGFLFF